MSSHVQETGNWVQLVLDAQKGDQAAFNELRRLMRRSLSYVFYSYARHVPTHMHEDLRQTIELGLWRSVMAYDPTKSTHAGYLFSGPRTYARDFALNRDRRSSAFSTVMLTRDGDVTLTSDLHQDVSEHCAERYGDGEDVEAVRQAVGRLPGLVGRVVRGRYFTEPPMSVDTLAAREGVAREKVRAAEARGLRLLREWLPGAAVSRL